MAKRFTDTEKWRKDFFRSLEPSYKIIWLYLLDDCNHAGVWEVEVDVLNIRTQINLTQDEILNIFGVKVKVFDDGKKWFIKDFIDFQYGELKKNNRAHLSVIHLLSSYKNKGLISPLQEAKDKDKDKDKDKEVEFLLFWDTYQLKTKLKKTDREATEKYWYKLTVGEKALALHNIGDYYNSLNDKKYCKKARTYLSDKNFNDEFTIKPPINPKHQSEKPKVTEIDSADPKLGDWRKRGKK